METTKKSLLLDWNDVVYEGRNELVFESKNREYGAYQIRREYHGNVVWSMGGALLVIMLCFGGPIIHGLLNKTAPEAFVKPYEDPLEPIPYTFPNISPPAPPTPPQPRVQTNLADIAPKVVPDDNLKPDEELPEQKPNENQTPGVPAGGEKDGLADNPSKGNGTELPVVPDEEENQVPVLIVPEMPEFKGGIDALYAFLKDNLVYPELPKELGQSGTVYVSFVIGKRGDVKDVKLLRGVRGYPEFDAEALRVIRKMPVWVPGKMNGHTVPVIMSLPIKFQIK